MSRTFGWLAVLVACATADAWAGDARQGAAVLSREQCLECHTVNGQGMGHEAPLGTRAPDFAQHLTTVNGQQTPYRPTALASAMWNHTVDMWREMSAKRAAPPTATAAEWEDVFAYLYQLRFNENPASFGRGRQVFETAGCLGCHAIQPGTVHAGLPVAKWTPVNDPVTLVWQMWNHAATMNTKANVEAKPWPILTGQDFMDLTAWIQHNQKLPPDRSFSLPSPALGHESFVDNCQSCHNGPKAIDKTVADQTFMDLGAGMWNHAPLMNIRAIPETEMRGILAWVWQLQYTGPAGNQVHGEQVFNSAGCLSCHRSPATKAAMRPKVEGPVTPFSMVAIGWGEGRKMHASLAENGKAWPKLTPDDMNDLLAYINTLPAAK